MDTRRNNNVIMTSQRRWLDVIMTLLSRRVYAGESRLNRIESFECTLNWSSRLNDCTNSVINICLRTLWPYSQRSVTYFCVFPTPTRQLLECQLKKKKLLCYSEDPALLLPKLVTPKNIMKVFIAMMKSGSHVFSCDQAALWMVFSVRPSVCHTFLTMFPSSYHHEIFRSY